MSVLENVKCVIFGKKVSDSHRVTPCRRDVLPGLVVLKIVSVSFDLHS